MYDVAIVGAGPGGAAAAYYLARAGRRVLLLDKATFPRDKTCGDALTPRALNTLRDMGLLERLQNVGYRLDSFQIVAPKGHSVAAPFPPNSDWPTYALIVPRLTLDAILVEHAQTHGAEFRGGINVIHIAAADDSAIVQAENATFRARMVVVATGASPTLLLRLGLLQKTPRMMLATRAYYAGLADLPQGINLYQTGVPLPGYGWVFPTSATTANIGAGLGSDGIAARWLPKTARSAFDSFAASPPLTALLKDARRVGPLKGYPLRADFGRAPTSAERLLLVGEAAGLVNPLTGDGIDYALESAHIAATHIAAMLDHADYSPAARAAYDAALRDQFGHIFRFSRQVRVLLVNRLFLDRIIAAAARRADLTTMMVNRVLGNRRIGKRNLLRALLRGPQQ